MSYTISHLLRSNMIAGMPTRTKSFADYTGLSIPPCGDFTPSTTPTRIPPWLQKSITTSSDSYSLHDEIKLFMDYMTPSSQEIATRKDLLNRFTTLISSFGTKATVVPVGSYVTGLYLPTSDIDMVLKPQNQSCYITSGLRDIYYKICRSDFASKVEDVLNASVPLIRITDKKTGIEIDLTAADSHGIKATQAIEKWLQYDTEIARMLIFVVKIFLTIRRCGTTYTGGVNSYVLVWMVVAWVRLEWPKIKSTAVVSRGRATSGNITSLTKTLENLSVRHGPSRIFDPTTTPTAADPPRQSLSPDFGKALKGFLRFYGHEFDYYNQAIKFEPTPRYQPKPYVYSRYTTQRFLLSIFDPADATIDMGAKAYGINHVKTSFQEAYKVLLATESNAKPEGILGAMLGGDFTKYVEKRDRLGRATG